MRLHLKTSSSGEIVPFNYQQYLTGAINKWVSENPDHDGLSLYSFSWLKGGRSTKKGLNFENGACFFISAYDGDFLKEIIDGIQSDPTIRFGLEITEASIQPDPEFENQIQQFNTASPVFVKRRINNRNNHFTFESEEVDQYLTETLQNKLNKAGLEQGGVSVYFDRNYPKARTKVLYYQNIGNRVNLCPVMIEGTPEQLQFAWNVGVGNSTGIGFGALN